MALWNMHFDKPGPGVRKNEPSKPPFIRFFQIYARKFWHLIKLNLLYVAFCIPFYIPVALAVWGNAVGSWFFYLSVLPILLTGPFTAGFVYELRDFARERPSFLWQDFKDAAWKNRRQALAAAAIGTIGFDFFCLLFRFYSFAAASHSVYYVFLSILCACGMLFLFMQYYVYLLLVTFDMKLKNIYRNAAIFSFLGLGGNVLITIVGAAILLVSIWIIPLLFLIPFITVATIGFLVVFTTWPLVKKHMIDPNDELKKAGDDTASIFKDPDKK